MGTGTEKYSTTAANLKAGDDVYDPRTGDAYMVTNVEPMGDGGVKITWDDGEVSLFVSGHVVEVYA